MGKNLGLLGSRMGLTGGNPPPNQAIWAGPPNSLGDFGHFPGNGIREAAAGRFPGKSPGKFGCPPARGNHRRIIREPRRRHPNSPGISRLSFHGNSISTGAHFNGNSREMAQPGGFWSRWPLGSRRPPICDRPSISRIPPGRWTRGGE